MATQIKGLSYFPVDVNIFEDDKLAIVESEYGFLATAIIIKLLCKIYSEGFYTVWDNRAAKLFRCKIGSKASLKQTKDVVQALVDEGFFDSEMFNKYGILTSVEIQSRFFEAISRRKKYKVEHEEYLLIKEVKETKEEKEKDEDDVCKNDKNVDNSSENANNSPENVDNSEQRKEKENILKNNFITSTCTTIAHAHAREGFSLKSYHEILANDEEWRNSVVQTSGKGVGILDLLPQVMPLFDAHIISIGETDEFHSINDYKRRFISWWRCMKFKTAEEIVRFQKNDKKFFYPYQPPKRISRVDEMTETTKRAVEMAKQMLHI